MGGEQRKFVVVGNWKMNGDKGCSKKASLKYEIHGDSGGLGWVGLT